jgi:type I restriction enzyme R subunit
MESFKDITIIDTRECLLTALRAIKDPDAAKIFEHNFKSLERLWEAVSPDPVLYEHRYTYNWLCSVYIAHRRRQKGASKQDTYGELSAKTRALIEENTAFMDLADSLPVFKIDKDYVTKLEELPSPADKAAALEAILTAELAEDDAGGFTYRQLGDRLARLKAQKDAADKAAEKRLKELQAIADEKAKADEATKDEAYLADCARRMVGHLRSNQLLSAGWSNSKGGRMRVEQSLLAESWNPIYMALGFDADDANPPFLGPAVQELVNSDGLG